MKKYLALFCALILLLAGCANGNADENATTPTAETQLGYYEENSPLELQTNGAVRQYALPNPEYRWIRNVGEQLLLATDSDPVQLQVLNGDAGVSVATAQLDGAALDSCQNLFNGFAYYDAMNHCVVYLDPQLNQTQNISLPADASSVVVSQDGNEIFYCVGKEIRAMDITRKISRLVKTQSVEKQTLLGTCFEGKIVICKTEDSAGNVNTLYISTENGQTLTTANNILSFHSYGENYLLERMDGVVPQRITGTLNGEAKQLNIDDANVTSALEIGAAIGYGVVDNGLLLNCYDLSNGSKTASITLPGVAELHDIQADKWSGNVWLLVSTADKDGMKLLRWNVKASSIQENVSYIGPLYTVDNPDSVSLDAIKDRVSGLNKKYGVRIRVYEEAVKSTGGYTLAIEHQSSAINEALDQVQAVLAEFPKNFVSKSISSKVRICLVRSVDEEAKAVQYWDGKYAFIVLSTGVDIRTEFLKGFGAVVDSHVLGNSPKYDYWDTLNPEGFMYGGTADESLTTGENRAFLDVESMKSATIERSRLFWQAMLKDNADTFKSDTMQKKLTMLCKAIRDAWNTEKSTEIFPWEQYLTKPIAKKK